MADSVIVALDAATGKTIWRTTFPERSKNVQWHKIRDCNPTPYVSDGIVYVVDYAHYLYALDAKSGKLIWDRPGKRGTFSAAKGRLDNFGPAVAEGTVLLNCGVGLVGLDAKTGKELWKGPGGWTLKWAHEGREYIILQQWPKTVSCLDPKTGKALWSNTLPRGVTISQDNVLGGDYYVVQDPPRVVCYRLSEQGFQQVWEAANPPRQVDGWSMTIANKHVYVSGSSETFCLNIENGEKVGTAKAGGERSHLLFAADDRVFVLHEQRHGYQRYFMLDGDPKSFRALGGLWNPPHLQDSSYANHSTINPVVDGRLFVRGYDGVYCFDLRKPVGTSGVPAVEPKSK